MKQLKKVSSAKPAETKRDDKDCMYLRPKMSKPSKEKARIHCHLKQIMVILKQTF